MDLQTSLLCLGLVVMSAMIIWIMSTLGTRGQSYEEVMAESRRLAAERGLLDDGVKSKKAQQQQSKKNKKAGKKVKEKQAKEQQVATSNSEPDSDTQVESGPDDESHHSDNKHAHVEFVETVVEPEMPPPKASKAKKNRGKEPKVKPILVNKDDPSCVSDVSAPPSPVLTEPANHFEQIHPKDEFELLHSHDKDKSDSKEKKDGKLKHSKGKGGNKQQEQGGKVKEQEAPPPKPSPVVTKQQEKPSPVVSKQQEKPSPIVSKQQEKASAVVAKQQEKSQQQATNKPQDKQTSKPQEKQPQVAPKSQDKQTQGALKNQEKQSQTVQKSQEKQLQSSSKSQEKQPQGASKAQEKQTQDAPREQRKGKKASEKVENVEKNVVSETVSVVSSSAYISQPANMTTDKILKQAYPLESAPQSTVVPIQEAAVSNGHIHPPQGKKKKKDIQLHQLTMGGDGLNVNLLVKLLSDASLSRSEIQILTDCLLNKQNGPLPEHSEWSEGPKDPVQRMKRQLAEKEKALTDEQEAHQALKAKLKELRASLNTEHSRCSQLMAAAEESNTNHRNEVASLQVRLQRTTEETSHMRQQIIQFQNKIAAEAEFVAQRSQMEMHIQALSEAKTSLTTAVGSLQAELAELRAGHAAANNDLHKTREQMIAIQHHNQELNRQLEEAKRMNSEFEAQRHSVVLSEQFLKEELHKANERLKGLNEVQQETIRLNSVVTRNQQILLQHTKQQEELERQKQLLTSKACQLKTENDELNNLVGELREQLAAQPTANGTTTPEKDDSVSVEKAIADACSELEAKHSQQIDILQRQLDQSRDKNNELRTKNWKVMDALQAAEKRIQLVDNASKSSDDSSLIEAINAAKVSEQHSTKEALQRLFPEVSVKDAPHEEWLQCFAEKVKQLAPPPTPAAPTPDPSYEDKIKEMEKQNAHLQSVVVKYKRVIDDTEGVLSRLQSNVTEEEQKWAKQLLEKQQELDNLKKNSISNLQDKITSLQETLEHERKLRLELENREPDVLSHEVNKHALLNMADIEILREENARLTEVVERLNHSGQSLNGPSKDGSEEK